MHANPNLPRVFRIHHWGVWRIANIFVVLTSEGQLPTHILAARLGSKTAHGNKIWAMQFARSAAADTASSTVPRINHRNTQVRKVLHIAGCQGRAPGHDDAGDQRVSHIHRPTSALA